MIAGMSYQCSEPPGPENRRGVLNLDLRFAVCFRWSESLRHTNRNLDGQQSMTNYVAAAAAAAISITIRRVRRSRENNRILQCLMI